MSLQNYTSNEKEIFLFLLCIFFKFYIFNTFLIRQAYL